MHITKICRHQQQTKTRRIHTTFENWRIASHSFQTHGDNLEGLSSLRLQAIPIIILFAYFTDSNSENTDLENTMRNKLRGDLSVIVILQLQQWKPHGVVMTTDSGRYPWEESTDGV